MKTFLRKTLVVAALSLGAHGMMAAQASSNEPILKQLVKKIKAREVTTEIAGPAQGARRRISSVGAASARGVERAR